MNEKDNSSSSDLQTNVTAITSLTIFIIIVTGILFVSSLILSQNHTAIAQQQEQALASKDISFDIDNVTFSHHMASVNRIQLHYVIGGHGNPIVLIHGWPQTWYEWRHVMPALAKNYTVIVPDLRGLGDSSKPLTGYDGKTTAEDIYQLVSQLGFKQIFLVGHDIGAQTAYSYAAAHPNNVSKLVIMDFIFPGFVPASLGTGPWWFAFHQTPDIPETLVQGKEKEYLTWFYKGLAYNPSAITQTDIDEFVSHYSAPGGMRAGFEYYRSFPQDAKDNKELAATAKLPMPVLVLAGAIYPALGGQLPGTPTLSSTQSLASNVHGVIVPLSGHWTPEERPDFVTNELANFFGSSRNNNTTNTVAK
jgi:pimeloyl-ACP methyl ester carboxylesterase